MIPGVTGLLLSSLARFYSDAKNMDAILPYINGASRLSLRMIEWFITNYCKRHNVVIMDDTGKSNINVYLSYRAQLKAYSKHQFDPFRRHDRISFNYCKDKESVETTVGQLNFFRWMLMYGVLAYMECHITDIETDLACTSAPVDTGAEQCTKKKSQNITRVVGRHTIDFC
jgi:hypothetical protein